MAIKGGNGEQLSFLMPARSVKNRVVESSDIMSGETLETMWDRKLSESKVPVYDGSRMFEDWSWENKPPRVLKPGVPSSQLSDKRVDIGGVHGAGVHRSLADHGYDGKPVEVEHFGTEGELYMGNGHHRVAAASDLGVDVMVSHKDTNSRRYWAHPERIPPVNQWHDVRLKSDRNRGKP